MKVRVTFECNRAFRKAISHYYGETNEPADRERVALWFSMHGESMNDDLRSEHGACCWGDKAECEVQP